MYFSQNNTYNRLNVETVMNTQLPSLEPDIRDLQNNVMLPNNLFWKIFFIILCHKFIIFNELLQKFHSFNF